MGMGVSAAHEATATEPVVPLTMVRAIDLLTWPDTVVVRTPPMSSHDTGFRYTRSMVCYPDTLVLYVWRATGENAQTLSYPLNKGVDAARTVGGEFHIAYRMFIDASNVDEAARRTLQKAPHHAPSSPFASVSVARNGDRWHINMRDGTILNDPHPHTGWLSYGGAPPARFLVAVDAPSVFALTAVDAAYEANSLLPRSRSTIIDLRHHPTGNKRTYRSYVASSAGSRPSGWVSAHRVRSILEDTTNATRSLAS